MKIAYVTPYEGEEEIVRAGLSDHDVVFYEQPLRTQVPEELQNAEVLSVFVDSVVSEEMIDSMPNLTHITLRSMGFDHVAAAHAKEKGITVSYVPRYGSQTVAEYAFALILALSRKAYAAYDALRTDGVRDVQRFEGFDLKGKTLGIIGTGAIGRHTAQIARGFGMEICAHDIYPNEDFAAAMDVAYCSFEDLVSKSDIVSLHVPSTPENYHLINEAVLRQMKQGAYLINTARGDLVDTVALTSALQSGHIAGAGLDVYEGEKFIVDEMELLDEGKDITTESWKAFAAEHALLDMPNVVVTPHVAFNSVEAKREITDTTIANIVNAIDSTPEFLVP